MTKGTNILHHTISRLLPAAALLLSLAAGSCTADDTSGVAADDRPVIVSANAVESALTRAVEYVDHGPIKSGTYYLSYPTANSNTDVAEVEFSESGYGRAMIMPGRGELTWKQIANGTTTDRTLCLTNVSPEKHNKYNANNPFQSPIVFKDDEDQFVAGRYRPYGDEHTNDILLGNKSSYREGNSQDHTSNYVHFEMHHCMARVRVIVETHSDENSFDPLAGLLNKAKVEITNVVLKPYSFTPYTSNLAGVVALYPTGRTMEDYCTFEPICLLDNLEDDSEDNWAAMGEDVYDDDGTFIGEAFTTEDILLPPQQLRADNNRPRLRITVYDEADGKEKVYSGVLPHIMYKEGSPLQFEFLAEHLLTIRTFIKNDPPELIFMPVQVVEWVDKGTYSLDAQESGIYSKDDFQKMMDYYADYNRAKLLQYGAYKDGKWVFKVFRNLTFDKDEIEEKMKLEEGKADYSFTFNTWYTVTVDGEKVTEKELKAILSGVPAEDEEEDTAEDTGDTDDTDDTSGNTTR